MVQIRSTVKICLACEDWCITNLAIVVVVAVRIVTVCSIENTKVHPKSHYVYDVEGDADSKSNPVQPQRFQ